MPAVKDRRRSHERAGTSNGKETILPSREAMEEDDDEEEEEYVVEEIKGHEFNNGIPLFLIKWFGWDAESDMTWEPEENLDNARDLLEAYIKRVGPLKPSQKKRKRQPTVEPVDRAESKSKHSKSRTSNEQSREQSDSPGRSEPKSKGRLKRAKVDDKDVLDQEVNAVEVSTMQDDVFHAPSDSWENSITSIDTVEKTYDPVMKQDVLAAFVTWKSGHQRRHLTSELRRKCPQLLISFYERHVILTPAVEYPDDEQ